MSAVFNGKLGMVHYELGAPAVSKVKVPLNDHIFISLLTLRRINESAAETDFSAE